MYKHTHVHAHAHAHKLTTTLTDGSPCSISSRASKGETSGSDEMSIAKSSYAFITYQYQCNKLYIITFGNE